MVTITGITPDGVDAKIRAGGPTVASIQAKPAGRYDPKLSLFNLKPTHFQKTRAALAASQMSSGSTKILFAGDSNTFGLGPFLVQGDSAPYSFPARFRDTLRDLGRKVSSDGVLFPAPGGDSRFTGSGGVGQINPLFAAMDGPGSTTFAPSSPSQAFQVTYLNAYPGTFTVSIDGGAPVSVTRTATGGFATWTSSALPLGAHTLTLTVTAGNSLHYPYVEALTYSSGITGIRVAKAGVSGSTASDWVTPTNNYSYLDLTRTWDADLVCIMLGTNDAQSSTVAAYKAALTSMVAAYRADGAEVLLIAPPARQEIDLTPYWQALYDLAAGLDLPLLDIRDRQGAYNNSATGYMVNKPSDTAHLSIVGHEDLARALVGSLL